MTTKAKRLRRVYLKAAEAIKELQDGGYQGWACNEIAHITRTERNDWEPEEARIFNSFFHTKKHVDGGGYWLRHDHEPRILALLLMAEIAKDF